MKYSAHLTGIAALCLITPAYASPELPYSYGARPLGMGGTAVAHVDDPGAIAVNPATLDAVKTWSANLTLSPFLPRSDAPFSANQTKTGERPIFPRFFAGGAVRVTDWLVTGLAVYVASGAGTEYGPIPEYGGQDMRLTIAVIEAAVPVAVRVTDEFSVGAALRFGRTMLDMAMPRRLDMVFEPARLDGSAAGNAFPGVLAGAWYRPIPELRFGAAYRSKMTAELSGDGTLVYQAFPDPRQSVRLESEWSTAHSFRAGVAYSPVEKLTLALDGTYTLLEDSSTTVPLDITFKEIAGAEVSSPIELRWQDSLAGFLGAEYRFTDLLAGRAGYSLTVSGTRKDYPDPLSPPPGLIHTANLGAGLNFAPIEADLAAALAFGGGADVDAPRNANEPGEYTGNYLLFAASVTYRAQ